MNEAKSLHVKKEKSPLPRRPEATKSTSSPALVPISSPGEGRDRRSTFHADSSFDRDGEEDDYERDAADDEEPERMKSS